MEREGEVKFFQDKKGYGFISCKDHDQDIFVHYKSIAPENDGFKTLAQGDKVSFLEVRSEKGLQAAEVYVID